jgi:hypothetical protein
MSNASKTVAATLSGAQKSLINLGESAIATAITAQSEMDAIQTQAQADMAAAAQRVADAIAEARTVNTGLRGLGHEGLALDSLPRVPRGLGTPAAPSANGKGRGRPKGSKNKGSTAAASGTRDPLGLNLRILSVVGEEVMTPSEITAAVVAAGFVTKSDDLTPAVNVALGKLAADKLIKKAARGQYVQTAKGVRHFASETE